MFYLSPLFQIGSLQIPISYTAGAFVPERGWVIFGGNATFNQTQHLRSIDSTWTIGEPFFLPDYVCIVQVIKKL
jgi:hypothetical protein